MRSMTLLAALALCVTTFASTAEARPKRHARHRPKAVAAAPAVPEIDPYRVKLSYGRLCVAIERAKALLEPEDIGTSVVGARHAVLAVWQPDRDPDDIRIVHIRDGVSQTRWFDVQAMPWNGLAPRPDQDTYNGVNTFYKVTSPRGWVALAIKTNTRIKPGAIYVPYNPAYQTPAVVANGRRYLLDVITKAMRRIAERRVMSQAFPGKLVSEVIDETVLLTLLVIEHTDRDETIVRGPVWAAEKMFTTVALNRENVYRYAISSAGAGGLAQFIPGTYKGTRLRYADAGLPESFTEGMADHKHAVVAQFCLADYSYMKLLETRLRKPRTLELLGAYLAAAYNGGEGKAVPAYRRHVRHCKEAKHAREWCTLSHGLYDETVNYLKKFAGTYRYLLRTR